MTVRKACVCDLRDRERTGRQRRLQKPREDSQSHHPAWLTPMHTFQRPWGNRVVSHVIIWEPKRLRKL